VVGEVRSSSNLLLAAAILSGDGLSACGHAQAGVTVTASASADVAEFVPILPADVAAGGQSVTLFRSLGSKTDCAPPKPSAKAHPVLHVRFPAPWSVVAEFHRNSPSTGSGHSPRPDLASHEQARDSGRVEWRRLLALVRISVLGDE